jgi:hypothetical protein
LRSPRPVLKRRIVLRKRALSTLICARGISHRPLLGFVYVGRLVILNPKSPGLLTAAVIVGFLVNPIWFGWLGLVLRRTSRIVAVTLGP